MSDGRARVVRIRRAGPRLERCHRVCFSRCAGRHPRAERIGQDHAAAPACGPRFTAGRPRAARRHRHTDAATPRPVDADGPVPQETQLAFEYTVLEMAVMGRYPHLGAFEIEGPDEIEVARDALRQTGTLHLESRWFNTLSGGEKQRVVIASALAQLENRGRRKFYPTPIFGHPPARRADRVAGPRLSARDPLRARQAQREPRSDRCRVDPRLEFRGRIVPRADPAGSRTGARRRADRLDARRTLIRKLYRRRGRYHHQSQNRAADGRPRRARPTHICHDHRPKDCGDLALIFGLAAVVTCLAGPARRIHDSRLPARVRHLAAVRRERRRADFLRRAAAARARRRPGRLGAGRVGRRAAGAAPKSARDAVHAGRVGRRGAGRDAGAHAGPAVRHRRFLGRSYRQLCRLAGRGRDRLRRWRARSIAASRPTCCCSPASR